jgi:hypothetical protein
MDHDRFVILPHGAEWLLRWNGRDLTTFRDRAEALHAATVAARMSRRRGKLATVLADQDRSAPADRDVVYLSE